ncbi:MAG: mRNA-degrading endonuclease [Nitrospirales bacterium]|nr:MAG: mRNA-degrading endonuclease [Nitrospirales bacterium]
MVIVNFDPQSRHEQKGRRPAMVVSLRLFNQHTGLTMVCPITNTNRHHPFHIRLPDHSSVNGFIMVEQIKSIDFTSRKIKFVEKAPQAILHEVLAILDACLYEDSE